MWSESTFSYHVKSLFLSILKLRPSFLSQQLKSIVATPTITPVTLSPMERETKESYEFLLPCDQTLKSGQKSKSHFFKIAAEKNVFKKMF